MLLEESVFWTNETKLEYFGNKSHQLHVQWPRNETCRQTSTRSTLKHRGGSVEGQICNMWNVVAWICAEYNDISRLSRHSGLKCAAQSHRRVLQQDNDPKLTAKKTNNSEQNRLFWNEVFWSPDLDLEHLELKRAVWSRNPSNLTQLEQFEQEKWTKTPENRCRRTKATDSK